MSKSKPLSRKHVEEYDSDDGFVEDAPPSKKRKSEPKQKRALAEGVQRDDDGNEYWEISGKRRVQISKFGKMDMVNIREYYEKDGKMLPGKKGISLSIEQYTALIEILPDIERVLKSKRIEVPRPQYGKAAAKAVDEEEEEEEEVDDEEDDDDEEVETSKSKGKLDKFKLKSNHEATSDEDED